MAPEDLARVRASYAAPADAEIKTNATAQKRLADAAFNLTADPFTMADITGITYHWCSKDDDGIDNTLADASRSLESQGNAIRALAFQFALTGDAKYAGKSLELMRAWAAEHTPVNIYDFHPDFVAATIDGMTTDGFCGERPWAFAADTMWQTYGLINASDAYLLLTRTGYALSAADDALVKAWIRRLAQAVNSSFHVWTKWADAHPDQPIAYVRYRSDNHLSWALLGLLAAGVALGDTSLVDYVLEGGSWDDGRSGPYRNPSPIGDVIDRAIEADGRVFEEKINRNPPIGYAFFHLWPMVMIARIDEVLGRDRIWKHVGQDGAGLEVALRRYAPYVTGTPVEGRQGNLTTYAFLYQLAHHYWPDVEVLVAARAKSRPAQIVSQSGGPIVLMFKGIGPAAVE